METYEVGDQPELTVTFTNTAGSLTNPSTVVFTVKNYDTGTSLTMPAATNPSVGVWSCVCPVITTAGHYRVRVVGTGTLNAAVQSRFVVEPLNV